MADVREDSVWDWSKKRLLTTFSNGSAPGFGVSSLHVINQWQGGMILTGSADGAAKLYRNYDPETGGGAPQLVSAFRVLGETVQVRRGAGLVLEWRQPGGTLLAGGDARVIKLWDAHTETALMDLDTHADAPCGALASERGGAGATFLAGTGDGGVRLLDRRKDEDAAVVRAYRAHSAWVQAVRWHPFYAGQFFTASLDGEVKLWDLRGRDVAIETWDQRSHGIAAMDVHAHAGVFAT
jgi:regulator-associated protein of mTOR